MRPRGLAAGVHQPLKLSGSPLALSGLKAAEDGKGLVLRVYEPSGARAALGVEPPKGWRVGGAVNLLEEPMQVGANDALSAFELRTLRLTPG